MEDLEKSIAATLKLAPLMETFYKEGILSQEDYVVYCTLLGDLATLSAALKNMLTVQSPTGEQNGMSLMH